MTKGGEIEWAVSLKSDKYSIDIFAVYADDYVYIVGLAHKRLSYPFLAKLSPDGRIIWAKIVNVTYPANTYELEGKIIRDGTTFIAWFSNNILFTFDENGKILDFYILRGEIEDIALINNTIYITLPIQIEYIENQKPIIVEKRGVKIEKIPTISIPISIKAVEYEFKVREIEFYLSTTSSAYPER